MPKFNRNRGSGGKGRRGRRWFQNNQQGKHTSSKKVNVPSEPVVCTECDKPEPAYKCPNCYKKYCSVGCCKEHKTHCVPPTTQEVVASTPAVPLNVVAVKDKRQYKCDFPTEDTVPLEKLLQIKNDETINSMLKSTRLQALITKLDEMPNPINAFRDIMKDSEFRAFSNTVLDIVGVKDEYNIQQ